MVLGEFDPPAASNSTGYGTEPGEGDMSNNPSHWAVICVFVLIAFMILIALAEQIVHRRLTASDADGQGGSTNRQTNDGKIKSTARRAEEIRSRLVVRGWSDDPPCDADPSSSPVFQILPSTKYGPTVFGRATGSSQPDHRVDDDIETGRHAPTGKKDHPAFENNDTVGGCAICLTSFSPGQLVCEPKNRCCHHVFHEKCMVSWLHKHSTCPICRRDYLVEEEQ